MLKNILCPYCNSNNEFTLKDELNQDDIEQILTKKIFEFKCFKCQKKFNIDYPLSVSCNQYFICYKKTIKKVKKHSILRLCQTFDDFKEKILILNDSLNDILIEFLKDYIKKQTGDELFLRYDSIDAKKIVFYDLQNQKYLGISKEFYDNLLKNAKIKKINKMIIVDQDSYIKYVKVNKL